MRDFADPFMDEKVVEPRDKDTMSLSACLNRIMLKVQNEGFCEEAVEELKADFDYVGQKMGQRTSLENVCRFCDEENFRSKVCKVGF
jgi:hypothetical protein